MRVYPQVPEGVAVLVQISGEFQLKTYLRGTQWAYSRSNATSFGSRLVIVQVFRVLVLREDAREVLATKPVDPVKAGDLHDEELEAVGASSAADFCRTVGTGTTCSVSNVRASTTCRREVCYKSISILTGGLFY